MDRFEPCFDTGGGDVAAVVEGIYKQSVLTGVLFNEFLQFALGGRLLCPQGLNRGLFFSEVTRNDQGRRNQVHLVFVLFDDEVGGLLNFLLFIFNNTARFRHASIQPSAAMR